MNTVPTKDDDKWSFMRSKADEEAWNKRQDELDMQWYEAEEEGGVFREEGLTGNDLIDSYQQQEIDEEEGRKKLEMQRRKQAN